MKNAILKTGVLLLIFCLLSSVAAIAQQATSAERSKEDLLGPWEFTPKVGYVIQRASGVEAGLFYGRGLDVNNSFIYEIPSYGAALGGELLFYNGTTFFMPKISAEYHSFSKAVGGRVDLSYYNVKRQQDLYIVPQAGLNFTSFLSLHFGYAVSLSGKKSEFLSPFKISIYLNAPKHFPRDGKFWPG